MTVAAFLFVLCAAAVFWLVSKPARPQAPSSAPTHTSAPTRAPAAPAGGEIRAVWMSFYELMLPEGMTSGAFARKFEALFKQCEALGLNTVFIHARPFSDAIYPSEHYPWSEVLTGRQGMDPGYDPLRVLCELAAAHGLSVHAWINPFRAARTADITRLSAGSPTLRHLNQNDGWVRKAAGQFFWNPAVPETYALIYDGVRELLRNYDIAGIHIDDYFYPTTDKEFDRAQYELYRGAGGALSQDDWRRDLIDTFVRGLYNAVKGADPAAVFSVSPAGDIQKNYDQLYADAALWAGESGYCDWMIPQLYYGFEHQYAPFEKLAGEWARLPRHAGCKLVFGLAAYKTGQEDEFAGGGRLEWTRQNDILARQTRFGRALDADGFALYSITNIARAEHQNLQNLLNDIG